MLGAALIIPAAGFLQAGGDNPLTLSSAALLAAGAAVLFVDAARPVLTVSRSGVVIRRLIGSRDIQIPWQDVHRVEAGADVVSLTTRDRMMYQIEVPSRVAQFVERAHRRILVSLLRS